jgi:Fic family protein
MIEKKNISSFEAGTQVPQIQYKSFQPKPIYYDWVIDVPEVQALLSDADRTLGMLNAYAHLVPDVDFFIQMHITKEATTSSQIEGTQTNMEDVLINNDAINPEKRDDREEVINYINAINFSIEKRKELPISNRLITETHKVLMQGVRGENKSPGVYRKSQNWIGASLRDATFIPPHHESISDLMADFEKFLHTTDILTPHLIRIAMLHYQFETIHPFLDGNGRMGRLLITLYLVDKDLMAKPALYLSDFFEHNRSHYYDNIQRVRTHNDMTQWLKFFLVGVIETAESSIATFKSILALKAKMENEILPKFGSRQKKALELMQFLYRQPIVTINKLQNNLKLNYSTAIRLINDFVDSGILNEMKFIGNEKIFSFTEYLILFNSENNENNEKINSIDMLYKNQIESALKGISQSRFEALMNHFLYLKGYKFIGAPGSVVGKDKTSKGAPDSFFIDNDEYVFAEYTTQEKIGESKSFLAKLIKDIDHCFSRAKTGISKQKIKKIILACNEKISALEYEQLKARIKNYNSKTVFEFYNIQNLPQEILNYPGLSEQYLGIQVLKGEIYTLSDFLIKTTRNLQPSLTNKFVKREKELEKSLSYLNSSSILLMTGSAGVGKSKLATKILEEYEKKGFIPIVIQSYTVPLWEDFSNLFLNEKDYIILFDDANKSIQNLNYLLEFVQKSRSNKIKLIITSRDYVKGKIELALNDIASKESITIEKFNDKVIDEIIIEFEPAFKFNPEIKERIIVLAKGNARLAIMAASSVVIGAENNYLNDPVLMYEKYFSKISEEVELFSSPIVLKTLAIISFFGVIEKNNQELRHQLEDEFKIDWNQLWEQIYFLHANEIVDVYENEIVKISDQVLATYAFYKCFIDDKYAVIDYSQWIAIFIKNHSNRIENSLIDSNNTFGYKKIKELVMPHLNSVAQKLESEEEKYSYYKLFWFYRPNQCLKFIKDWIFQLPKEKLENLEFSYVHNNHSYATKYFELLVKFWNIPNETLKPSLEIALMLVEKQNNRMAEFMKFIYDCFSYKWEDLNNGYYRQSLLFEILTNTELSKDQQKIGIGTALNIGETLMGWHFTQYGGMKGNAFTIKNFDLYVSKELVGLRGEILELAFEYYECHKGQSTKIFNKIIFPEGKMDKKIYESELPFYNKLIQEKYNSKNLSDCKFVRKLTKVFNEYEIEIPNFWNEFINSDIIKISKFLKTEWETKGIKSYREIEEEKNKEIRDIVFEKNWNELEQLLFDVDNFVKQVNDTSAWFADSSITELFKSIALKDKNELINTLRLVFLKKITFGPNDTVIAFILENNILHSDELIELIKICRPETENNWIYAVLTYLPSEQVTEENTKLLIDIISSFKDPVIFYKISVFSKYNFCFKKLIEKKKILVEPNHNVITYLTQITLEKVTSENSLYLGYNFFQENFEHFKDNIELLKKAYYFHCAKHNHFDYDGKEMEAILKLDENFLTEYLRSFTEKADFFSLREEHLTLDYIWKHPHYEKLITDAINVIISKAPVFSNFDHPACHLFHVLQIDEEIKSRFKLFLENFIKMHNHNLGNWLVIINVIQHRFNDSFIKYLKQFFRLNSNFEFFRKMFLSTGGSYSGSRVPIIQQEIDLCYKIINTINELPNILDFTEHTEYLENKINWLKKDIVEEQKREFSNSFYDNN